MKFRSTLIYTTFTLLCCVSLANGAEVSGIREITILNESTSGKTVPEWKRLWDNARQAVQDGSWDEAKELYTRLISLKPNIELIQYEFARVLIFTQHCGQAVKILETLIYQQPDKLSYYLPTALCFENIEQFGKASTYYGTLYDKAPYGPNSIGALQGLIRSLDRLDRHSAIIPLLQQLVNRKPEDSDALLQLARELRKNGETKQAAEYYIQLVNRFRVDKAQLLEIAQVLNAPEYSEQLLKIRQQYLEYEPTDRDMRRKVADSYLLQNRYKEALEQLLILDKQQKISDPRLLEIMGGIYLNQMNRPDKALHYFERYNLIDTSNEKIDGQIAEIQQKLAEDFVVIVQNDGARMLWKDLQALTRGSKTIFLLIAQLLEEADDQKSLVEVLAILHATFQDDLEITYNLTSALLQNNRYSEAAEVLLQLDSRDVSLNRFQKLLVNTIPEIKDPRISLAMIERLDPDIHDDQYIIKHAFEYSVEAGYLEKAYHYFGVAEASGMLSELPLGMELTVFEYLDKSGEFASSATYCQKLLMMPELTREEHIAVKSFMALSLSRQGDRFGAEQQLRDLVFQYPDNDAVYLNLADFLNRSRKFEQAEKWLNLLQANIESGKIVVNQAELKKQLQLINGKKYIASYDYDEAVADLMRVTAAYPEDLDARLVLIKVLFLNDEFERCAEIIESVQADFPGEPMSLLAAQLLFQKDSQRFGELKQYAVLGEAFPFDQKIDAYRQLRRENDLILSFQQNKDDASSRYVLFQMAQIYEDYGMYTEADAMLNRYESTGEDDQYVKQKKIELAFKNRQYQQFVTGDVPESIFTSPTYAKYKTGLLYARSLWAVGRWDESLQLYKQLLRPSVVTEIEEAIDIEENQNPGSWAVIYTHGGVDEIDDIENLLDPETITGIIEKPLNGILNGFYSQVKWEKMIQQELTARTALRERDYFYAESQYEKLMKESDEVSETKLLDLATIYNRLGKHSQEAEVYASMPATRSADSDISTQVQKNKNLLKPKTGIVFNNQNSKGRDGYKDIAVHEYGATSWFHTGSRQSLDAYYSAIQFSDNKGDKGIFAHRLYGKYTAEFNENYLVSLAYGGLKRESAGTTALYGLRAEGQVDEYLKAYFEMNQDIVDDTSESVAEGISRQDYQLGFLADSIPRIIVGGSGTYRVFSDGNDQQMFHLFSSYNIFKEKYLFRIQYDFESIISHEENTYLYDENDLPYWAPSLYQHHYITGFFDYLIKDNTSFGGAPGHLSVKYSLGYENNEDLTHHGEMNIFLEMNRNILLKGTISFFNSDNYESRNGLLSLVYRW